MRSFSDESLTSLTPFSIAVEIVTIPEPLPLPGQLKLVTERARLPEPADPRRRVGDANDPARIQPVRDGFLNAIQLYPWTHSVHYQVYTAPGQITDIALQEGEQLVGPGPVAGGDMVRWIIIDTVSGSGATARVHILAKPTRPDLAANLVINTCRDRLRGSPALARVRNGRCGSGCPSGGRSPGQSRRSH